MAQLDLDLARFLNYLRDLSAHNGGRVLDDARDIDARDITATFAARD